MSGQPLDSCIMPHPHIFATTRFVGLDKILTMSKRERGSRNGRKQEQEWRLDKLSTPLSGSAHTRPSWRVAYLSSHIRHSQFVPLCRCGVKASLTTHGNIFILFILLSLRFVLLDSCIIPQLYTLATTRFMG